MVRECDKIYKDLLIQIMYVIDENILVQCYVVGLLQNIYGPLRMHEVKNCEEALKLAQRIETDDKGQSTNSSTRNKLEEKIAHLKILIIPLSFQKNNLWCIYYRTKGHTKEKCKFVDYFNQVF